MAMHVLLPGRMTTAQGALAIKGKVTPHLPLDPLVEVEELGVSSFNGTEVWPTAVQGNPLSRQNICVCHMVGIRKCTHGDAEKGFSETIPEDHATALGPSMLRADYCLSRSFR